MFITFKSLNEFKLTLKFKLLQIKNGVNQIHKLYWFQISITELRPYKFIELLKFAPPCLKHN